MHPSEFKWYDRKYLVASLIFLFPPLGFYALWKSKVFPDFMQIGITAAYVIALFVIFNFNQKNEDPALAIMEKKIKQDIIASSWGTIKKVDIDSIAKIEDRMCYVRYQFYNDKIDQNVRVSKKYIFLPDFSKIVQVENLTAEIKAEGEWVPLDFRMFD